MPASRKKTTQYPLHYVTYVPILRLLRPTVFRRCICKKRDESMDGRTDNWPNLVHYWYMHMLFPNANRYNMIKVLISL